MFVGCITFGTACIKLNNAYPSKFWPITAITIAFIIIVWSAIMDIRDEKAKEAWLERLKKMEKEWIASKR